MLVFSGIQRARVQPSAFNMAFTSGWLVIGSNDSSNRFVRENRYSGCVICTSVQDPHDNHTDGVAAAVVTAIALNSASADDIVVRSGNRGKVQEASIERDKVSTCREKFITGSPGWI